MEEVWKDISLPSLNEHPVDSIISTRTHNPSFPGTILLDFLATPIDKETPSPRTSAHVSNDTSVARGTTALLPNPGSLLSLKSGSDFQFVERGDPVMRPDPAVTLTGYSHSSSTFNGFGSSMASPSFCKKRTNESHGNSNDQRHKRMMKNRESAARSRARKQAYTYELELEVAHLQEENAKLKRQQQKLLSAAAAPDEVPKRNSLSRTLTAPF